MKLRIGLVCACLAGLTACVATPAGPNSVVSAAVPLPASQNDLRAEAAVFDQRFREAGWVAEARGTNVQRITGILMFGRGDSPRETPIDIYYARAGLIEAGGTERIEQARIDLEEATQLTRQLAASSLRVFEDPAVTGYNLRDDVAVLEYAIADVRQALSLFRSVDEDAGSDGALTAEIREFREAFDGLSAAADALAERRRELRSFSGS